VEDAQARDLVRKIIGIGFRIGFRNPEQYDQSSFDFADGVSFNNDAGARDALDDSSHVSVRIANEANQSSRPATPHQNILLDLSTAVGLKVSVLRC
jgi:hypothetical protein